MKYLTVIALSFISIQMYSQTTNRADNLIVGSSSTNVNQMIRLQYKQSTAWHMGIYDNVGSLFTIGDGGTNTNRFVIQKGTGNVGVGVLRPEHKLDVSGGIQSDRIILNEGIEGIYKKGFGFGINSERGYIFRQGWRNTNGDYIEIINQDACGAGERKDYCLRIGGSTGFQFVPREKEAMRITNDGNVGIGTNKPNYKLDVEGTIRANEIKVTAQTADFVFEPDYNLRPLNEVEAFVKTNKHLPEIPSAIQMEADGVNVAEMNKLLLQKVEELTLYMIEQGEKIEKQNKIIQKYDESNKTLIKRINLIETKIEE